MKITKIGHCCLLIEIAGKKILTDPGIFSHNQNTLTGIDAVLITHEHPDHFHIDSLKQVLANNSDALVITNTSVAELITKSGLQRKVKILEDGQDYNFCGVRLKGCGAEHADIYPSVPKVQNTGYFIGQDLFYPGDAFYVPHEPVNVLALPVSGPWMLLSEAIDYALKIRPKLAFSVHDGFLKVGGPFHSLPSKILSENKIEFKGILEGMVI